MWQTTLIIENILATYGCLILLNSVLPPESDNIFKTKMVPETIVM
jgi:hypothetical protein